MRLDRLRLDEPPLDATRSHSATNRANSPPLSAAAAAAAPARAAAVEEEAAAPPRPAVTRRTWRRSSSAATPTAAARRPPAGALLNARAARRRASSRRSRRRAPGPCPASSTAGVPRRHRVAVRVVVLLAEAERALLDLLLALLAGGARRLGELRNFWHGELESTSGVRNERCGEAHERSRVSRGGRSTSAKRRNSTPQIAARSRRETRPWP